MTSEREARSILGTRRCSFYPHDNGLRIAGFGEVLEAIESKANAYTESVKKKLQHERRKRPRNFLDSAIPCKILSTEDEPPFFPNGEIQYPDLSKIEKAEQKIFTKSRDPRLNRIRSIFRKSRNNGLSTPVKRVSFDVGATQINKYEINSGNAMKKCPSKDVPLLVQRRRRRAQLVDKQSCPQFQQFLINIFRWDPEWLEDEKQTDERSLVLRNKKLERVLPIYETYRSYFDSMEPLLMLELWHGIVKNFEADGNNLTNRVVSSMVNNSINSTTIPSTNIRVTTLMLEVVVSRLEMNSKSRATSGDLVLFEYFSNTNGNKRTCKVFAHVTSIRESSITPSTHFNRNLLNFVKEPYVLLTYTLMTKPLDPSSIEAIQTVGLRKISCPRINMQMVQALQYVVVSPLLEQILHPKVEDFQLATGNNLETNHPSLTKGKLNAKQLEAVDRITETVVQQTPKICLIEGPPGTGKSRIIVNLVMKILYGGGRYAHEQPLRILVCSSSDAAIDEIVLRLAKIRETISETDFSNRFKMVRIGESEATHPSVRRIALSELAKPAVKKTTAHYLSQLNEDCIEEEERKLQARINALELELLSPQNSSLMDSRRIARKLNDVKVKYDLITSRKSAQQMDSLGLDNLQTATEETLLAGADIIACPLESCYTDRMQSVFSGGEEAISVCIIDEATRCTETETLVPLMLGIRTLILVGDSNEEPSSVKSKVARDLGLNQSLFSRVRKAFMGGDRDPIIRLDTQYRMSYPVSLWPNRRFYGGVIKNAAYLQKLPFPRYKLIEIAPVDVSDGLSLENEIIFIAHLVESLVSQSNFRNVDVPVRIGIITTHESQNYRLRYEISNLFKFIPHEIKKKVVCDANTIDQFRGQERDVIIVTCIGKESFKVLSEREKLCVALTRAKHSLIVCGNFHNFWRDSLLSSLVADSRSRGVYVKMTVPFSLEKVKRYILP
ncbi:probable helicase senataxin isoform X2 [Venturia canescens]|uniref:probable helicase senataxin isoform X2 n=1 Tax=Venturia canescens TaxID=32260 RepID=UPI001C9BEAEA|nr:probable helicase senataxin isoform X2 [Venturia canescens]